MIRRPSLLALFVLFCNREYVAALAPPKPESHRMQLHSMPKRTPPRDAQTTKLALNPLDVAEKICPRVGVLTSTFLYLSPALAVLKAIRSSSLGDLNPLPLAIMSVSSVAWFVYGLSASDPFVVLSNTAGCIASIGYVVALFPLLVDKRQLRITQTVVMTGVTASFCLWTFLCLSGATISKASSVLGLFASSLFIILSGSPLSTIEKVVSTRNSSSILASLTAAQVINTSLWSAYGLAVRDKFVWGPNVVGLFLGAVQLTLKILFPSKKS
mmetsp:Transcript_31844/g.48850  ORF Transcript_31844/g.48850 Transcript_31844/m.48850 type:complete len:270 (+) Transcript_31844:103-912(+)